MQWAYIFLWTMKGYRDGLSYTPPLKKAKKQGEMPLASLSPIPSKMYNLGMGWDWGWVMVFSLVSLHFWKGKYDKPWKGSHASMMHTQDSSRQRTLLAIADEGLTRIPLTPWTQLSWAKKGTCMWTCTCATGMSELQPFVVLKWRN